MHDSTNVQHYFDIRKFFNIYFLCYFFSNCCKRKTPATIRARGFPIYFRCGFLVHYRPGSIYQPEPVITVIYYII